MIVAAVVGSLHLLQLILPGNQGIVPATSLVLGIEAMISLQLSYRCTKVTAIATALLQLFHLQSHGLTPALRSYGSLLKVILE